MPITYQGKQVIWQPDSQIVAFQPTAFQNETATRVNLVMRASQQAVESLTALDQYIVNYSVQNSETLFGKTLSIEEVKLRYSPSLKQSEKGYEPTFKAKINLSGRGKLNCWDTDGKQRDAPDSWIGTSVQPRMILKCLWIMPKEFGCLFDCSDALIAETSPENTTCPF